MFAPSYSLSLTAAVWLWSDAPFKLREGSSIAPCFLLGRWLWTWLPATAMALIKQRPRSPAAPGRAEHHSLLALDSKRMWVGKKVSVEWLCENNYLSPREPPGIWNRLGHVEAVNTADHAERGGEHPKGPGLPDFRVRPGISGRPWMGSLGSWCRKGAFLHSPLFKRETFFFPPLVGGRTHV